MRNGHRLCRMLYGGLATRWRFYSSAKSEQSLSHQINNTNVDTHKHGPDDGTVSEYSQPRQWTAVAKRPKPLTREPFVKNLFLGKFDTVSFILSHILVCC